MSERFPAGKPAHDILSIVFILNPAGAKNVSGCRSQSIAGQSDEPLCDCPAEDRKL
jgi:hypothetical protein